jgi:cobalamin biosynthesis protein CbiD
MTGDEMTGFENNASTGIPTGVSADAGAAPAAAIIANSEGQVRITTPCGRSVLPP